MARPRRRDKAEPNRQPPPMGRAAPPSPDTACRPAASYTTVQPAARSPTGLAPGPTSPKLAGMSTEPDARPEDDELEALKRAVREADAEVERGEFVEHDRVREWLLRLAQGSREPAPEPAGVRPA
jgi:hypothetical protein